MNRRILSIIVLFSFASISSVAVPKTRVKIVMVWSDSESPAYESYKSMDGNAGLNGMPPWRALGGMGQGMLRNVMVCSVT